MCVLLGVGRGEGEGKFVCAGGDEIMYVYRRGGRGGKCVVFFLCVCVCACMHACECMCVCGCVLACTHVCVCAIVL